MDVIETVEWIKPTERETVIVRLAIETKKDIENQRDERRITTTNQSQKGN